MKIVVIGGSGLIGTRLIAILKAKGHETVAASPSTGVNSVTGEGLDAAVAGADAVVDVSNAPSWEAAAVLDFFERSTRNQLAAESRARVPHHIALSIVGTDRAPGNSYFLAKLAQEKLIKATGVPYTIVRATQFFEFVAGIAEAGAIDGRVVVSSAAFQPIAADDVAAALADAVERGAINDTIEIAGPDKAPLSDFVARRLQAAGDSREVIGDANAPYYGAPIDDRTLTPGEAPHLGAVHFDAWLAKA